jgi:hypothetical protein
MFGRNERSDGHAVRSLVLQRGIYFKLFFVFLESCSIIVEYFLACFQCFDRLFESSNKANCPICHRQLKLSELSISTDSTVSTSILKHQSDEQLAEVDTCTQQNPRDSCKTKQLIAELNALRESAPGTKSVVFSQWVTMLV